MDTARFPVAKGTDTEPTTITVRFQDVVDGRAYIRIPPEGRIKLVHRAGAPWNEKIPGAELHDLQKEILLRPEREKIVHGATRLGKSVLGGCEAICELMLPGAKLAVIAGRFDHVGAEWQYIDRGMRNLFKGCEQAFTRLKFKHQQNYHVYDVETIWDSRGQGFSIDADDGAALLGREFSRAILGEGSHISKEILEKRIWRALDGWLMQSKEGFVREGGYLSIYTTPKGYDGCSAAEWDRILQQTRRQPEKLHYGRVPFPETAWVREANILENPYFDKSVYEARKRALSQEAFEEQYQGKMTFKTGRIWKSFSDDKHVVSDFDEKLIRSMRLGVGIDTGAYTGISLGGIGPDRRLRIIGEVYTQQRTITESLEEFREMMVETLGPAFRTSEFDQLKDLIDIWVIDPASQHKLEIMEDLGGEVALSPPVPQGGGKLELIPSVEVIEEMFKQDRILIHERCDWTADQIRKYVWKQRKAATRGSTRPPVIVEPRKEYDHLCDSLRFLVTMLDQLGPRDEPAPAITYREAWKQAQRDRVFGPLQKIMENAEQSGGQWV